MGNWIEEFDENSKGYDKERKGEAEIYDEEIDETSRHYDEEARRRAKKYDGEG